MEKGEYVGKHVKQDEEYDPWAELTKEGAEEYAPKHAKAESLEEMPSFDEHMEEMEEKSVADEEVPELDVAAMQANAEQQEAERREKQKLLDDKFEEVKRLIYRMEEGGR